ncbi:hypothetical protein HDU91_000369 [Kappamyces sp. JEL0680]|nr:hypothetical protein HDU91_000369 [Kappamyces sp. JEL0680]
MLSLNDTVRMHSTYDITITNNGAKAKTYSINNRGAAMLSPFAEGDDAVQPLASTKVDDIHAAIQFTTDGSYHNSVTVTVGPKSSVKVTLKVTPPAVKSLVPIYSGFVEVSNDQDTNFVTVPYAGIAGDYSAAPVWVRSSPSYLDWAASAFVTNPNDPSSSLVNPNLTTLGTNIYSNSFDMTPLKDGYTWNATDGLVVLPIFASSTRFGTVRIEYSGSDAKTIAALKAFGLDPANLGSAPLSAFDFASGNVTSDPLPLDGFNQRNAPVTSQSVSVPAPLIYTGLASDKSGNNTYYLPSGQYKIKFVAGKNFGKPTDLDVIETVNFNLIDDSEFHGLGGCYKCNAGTTGNGTGPAPTYVPHPYSHAPVSSTYAPPAATPYAAPNGNIHSAAAVSAVSLGLLPLLALLL